MFTRREVAKNFGLAAAALAIGGEAAYAQRRLLKGRDLSQLVLLNSNENPDGPPPASIEAMMRALPLAGRYHDDQMDALSAAIAAAESIKPEEVLMGCGSSEILHCAVDAFTSPTLPLITTSPAYELPVDLATAQGHPVVKLPMTADYSADVRRMAAEAEKAKGGLIYVVNPNNPTSSITPKTEIAWLVENLPANTVALIDEAYIHFSTHPDLTSAVGYVRQGKNVVVARTFSKIYGMAGLRAGFSCARADLTVKMAAFRNNTIPLTASTAARAALAQPGLIPERRKKLEKIRGAFCSWLDERGYQFIPPHANFVMIGVKRDVREVIAAMLERGVALGRPFPPLDTMMRVTIGSEADMARFREVFPAVMRG